MVVSYFFGGRKMKIKSLAIPAFALGIAQLSQPCFADKQNPFIDGMAMAWQCAPCHGTNGQEFTEAMPSIAGMKESEIIESMIAFREGTRPAVIMDRVSRGFTDDEIKAMAAFFSKQPQKQWDDTTLEEAYANQISPRKGGVK